MPRFRGIITFTHPRGGWSETYYWTSSTADNAENLLAGLATVRAALIAPPSAMTYTRLSDLSLPRSSKILQQGDRNAGTFFNTLSDAPWTCALIRCSNVQYGLSRTISLRGNPDGIYDDPQFQNADWTKFKTRLNAFCNYLITSPPLEIRAKVKPQANTRIAIKAATVPVGAAGGLRIDFDGLLPVGLDVDKLVSLYKMKGLAPAPGLVRVTQVAQGTPLTNPPVPSSIWVAYSPRAGWAYQGGAYFLPYTPDWTVVTSAGFEKFSHRDVGRPFGLGRGRRPSIRRF
jgi:hypothetical protein